MTWLFYRGGRRQIIRGGQTGTEYTCEPRTFIQADAADVPQLLQMVKAKCGCGRLFQKRRPRGA